MDPISIIGITTTAFGIVERLSKTLKFLLKLSRRCKFTEAKLSLLIGYIGSLNVAIIEIANSVKGFSGIDHYKELLDTLDATLECTKFSLSFLESKINGLHIDTESEMSLFEKVTIIFNRAELDEYLNCISSYVNALNLLLTTLQR